MRPVAGGPHSGVTTGFADRRADPVCQRDGLRLGPHVHDDARDGAGGRPDLRRQRLDVGQRFVLMDPEEADDPAKVQEVRDFINRWTAEREAMDIELGGIARASNPSLDD
ncbi:hypothetical protein [Streptomyces sp. LaBMicrA B280]|uniref:hypothetical protein n=1 Tax=Streptomyces sp. LaBMicrA B280 TaxID=3391001 RepID=UPI003BA55979